VSEETTGSSRSVAAKGHTSRSAGRTAYGPVVGGGFTLRGGVFKSDSHFRFCVRSRLLVSVRGRSWSAWLCPGDERLNFDDGIQFAVQDPAVQEPQQVLRESLRVQDVGDVLLSGQYQPLCFG
jgi:hypothetical protein